MMSRLIFSKWDKIYIGLACAVVSGITGLLKMREQQEGLNNFKGGWPEPHPWAPVLITNSWGPEGRTGLLPHLLFSHLPFPLPNFGLDALYISQSWWQAYCYYFKKVIFSYFNHQSNFPVFQEMRWTSKPLFEIIQTWEFSGILQKWLFFPHQFKCLSLFDPFLCLYHELMGFQLKIYFW